MPDQTETPYEKNTRLQYEALGRFVEQFEMMVNEVREISLERLLEGLDDHQKGGLIEIAFHHSVMTAKPLFDIMRAILADALNIPAHPHYKDRAIFKEVLGHIEKNIAFSTTNETTSCMGRGSSAITTAKTPKQPNLSCSDTKQAPMA